MRGEDLIRKSHLRGLVKWGGLLTCLVLIVALPFSVRGIYCLQILSKDTWWQIGIGRGALRLQWGLKQRTLIPPRTPQPTISLHEWSDPRKNVLVPRWKKFPETWMQMPRTEVDIPIWLPLTAVASLTTFLMVRDRQRPRPGHCHKCGYNLKGNVSGVCPECGERI